MDKLRYTFAMVSILALVAVLHRRLVELIQVRVRPSVDRQAHRLFPFD